MPKYKVSKHAVEGYRAVDFLPVLTDDPEEALKMFLVNSAREAATLLEAGVTTTTEFNDLMRYLSQITYLDVQNMKHPWEQIDFAAVDYKYLISFIPDPSGE